MRARYWAAALTLVAGAAYGQNPAYDFRDGGIRADRIEHWRHWTFQNSVVQDMSVRMDSSGLFEFTEAGVKPRYYPALRNAVLNRQDFEYLEKVVIREGRLQRGEITSRTNNALAGDVGDGDLATYWQPGDQDYTSDGLRNWQININLGRAIWADSVVVVCPPVAEGGEVVVPPVPEEAMAVEDLPVETRAAVEAFARGTALDSVVAQRTLVTEAGDTLVREGDVLIASGQQLRADLDLLKKLNQLEIATVAVQSDQDPGDVPKLFVVEVGDGRRSGDSSSRDYRYSIVGRGSRLGNQRRFVFPLEPLDKADWDNDGLPDFKGYFVHFVRLSIYESDLGQLEFLGEGEEGRLAYESLAQERRGQRFYFRRTQGNFLKLVAEDIYNGLPESERGPVRYYKRELPRIAEIQVWTPGDNVAYRPDLRAGIAYEDGQGTVFSPNSFDGVYITRWQSDPYHPLMSTNGGSTGQIFGTVWLDLGATFWVNRLYSGSLTTTETSNEGALVGFQIFASDGTALRPIDLRRPSDYPQLEYGLAWEDIVSEEHQDNYDYRVRILGEEFPLKKIRFLQYRHFDYRDLNRGVYGLNGYIAEMQLYGEGYPAEVSFTSPPIILERGIELGEAGEAKRRQILSEISWDAEAVVHRMDPIAGQHVEEGEPLSAHPEVEVQIQTRTSDIIDSLVTYYEITGYGTSSEAEQETDESGYLAVKLLWDDFRAWDALPASRVISLRPHQTRRDDDGDRLTDEDRPDGIDNDGDKLIDEDGLTGDVGGPIGPTNSRSSITLTKHATKTDDDGDGATDEDIIDGVDNDGDSLIDEDGKKKTQPRSFFRVVYSPVFAGWSPWSTPYGLTGGENRARITSPSPRRFLQVRVNLVSDDPDVTGRISYLGVDLAPPITTDVVGELASRTPQGVDRGAADLAAVPGDYEPPRDIPPLETRPFSYFVRTAGPDPNDPAVVEGFDEVLLVTPFPAQLTGVRLGQVTLEEYTPLGSEQKQKKARSSTFDVSFWPGADRVFRDQEGNVLQVEASGDSVLMRFPTSVNRGAADLQNRLVELQFDSQVLMDGAQVAAYVRASGETFFQLAEMEARDATELVDSQTSVPRLRQAGSALGEMRMPSVITPNGDGINDRLAIELSLLYLRAARPLELRIFDLAGRLVFAQDVEVTSGVVPFEWDGRDLDGEMVTPGIYACQVNLKSDEGDVRTVRLVSVAY
ncbi:MAG: gliding motility-associated C-terminal domain-containing protein [Candidatus Latescibacterota bacterium]